MSYRTSLCLCRMYRTTYRTRPYVFHRSAAEGGGGEGVQAWWPSPPWKGRCRHRGRALAQQGAFPPVRNVAAISACGLTVCTSPVVACLCDRVCPTRFMQGGYEGDDAGLHSAPAHARARAGEPEFNGLLSAHPSYHY